MDYLMYRRGIDGQEFSRRMFDRIMYSSQVHDDSNRVIIELEKD